MSEEKKAPLRTKEIGYKKQMLSMHYKGNMMKQNQDSKFVNPSDYVSYLEGFKEISYDKLYKCIESLRIALTNNPVSWVKEFGENQGLKCIMEILKDCYDCSNPGQRQKLQHECIKCLKALMNNSVRIEFAHVMKCCNTNE